MSYCACTMTITVDQAQKKSGLRNPEESARKQSSRRHGSGKEKVTFLKTNRQEQRTVQIQGEVSVPWREVERIGVSGHPTSEREAFK